jgi:hypothetical protein
MITNRNRRGFALLSMLLAVAIIGILTTNYFSADVPGGKPWAIVQQDRARSAVTAVNTRTANVEYMMATEGRRPDPQALRAMMDTMSQRMGGGGRFFVDHREQVNITTMMQTPRFREKANLPAWR